MAASGATIAVFLPGDAAEGSLQQASVTRKGTLGVLRFGADGPQFAEFEGIFLRPTLTGYSATAGINVNIRWVSEDGKTTGAVKWVAQIVPVGITDKPDPTVDLWSSTYENTVTTTVNTTQGGANNSTVACTKANIKGAQTTDAAAGDFFRLRIRREKGDAADTLQGAALFYIAELVDA